MVYNQPSELSQQLVFEVDKANSIQDTNVEDYSLLQKKRYGFIGEHVVKSDFEGKNIPRLWCQST